MTMKTYRVLTVNNQFWLVDAPSKEEVRIVAHAVFGPLSIRAIMWLPPLDPVW